MDDYFVRFAFHRNEVKPASGQIHPKLFSPPSNLRLSMEFVVVETTDSEIRTRGVNAARRRGKPDAVWLGMHYGVRRTQDRPAGSHRPQPQKSREYHRLAGKPQGTEVDGSEIGEGLSAPDSISANIGERLGLPLRGLTPDQPCPSTGHTLHATLNHLHPDAQSASRRDLGMVVQRNLQN